MRRVAFFLALLWASAAHAQCPTNYVWVANNTAYQRGYICVAKYEMKNVGGVATSQASGTPWVSITRANASAACVALGPQYRLMGNSDRMTIARDIEATASNWSTGIVNSGEINRGHNDQSPNNTLAANADDDQACEGTGQTCSSTVWDAQRRTHNLSTGGVIWDFAGNVSEWVEWSITNTDKASPQAAWIDIINSTPTTSMPNWRYWPVNPATTTLTRTNGVGGYYPGESGSGGYVAGGGHYYNQTDAGIYALRADLTSSTSQTNVGFRCVVDLNVIPIMHSRQEGP